ncbi:MULTISPECIES: ChuX/HutX family heme-like substrate-binding protein [unclassified Neisseria]|uniref:ChuX/HutX family heme-like substrate-binding protein n=1 Tax=unclassified Neisseria TaxID=2623750 RepID=UPI001D16A736|nr:MULTISPECIES: ChuX/HutX family heme-like substrate-binding protein [unclassified Neisseria]
MEQARDQGLEIMIFSGNRGVVQIQTGRVHNLVRARGWLNILDAKEEGFSLHLKDDEIAETWVVRRPIREGFVICLEGFDNCRKTVIQIFGRRQEGETEPAAWHSLTGALLAG